MVRGAGIGVGAGGRPDRPGVPVHLLRVQGKQLRRLHDSDCRRPNGHFHGSVCARAASDVCRRTRHVIGTPLALGSWWGLFAVLLILPVLIWRLLDEERFLRQNLAGYAEYQTRVKYRLLPFIW